MFLALGFSFEKRELEYLYSLLMQFMFFFLCNMFLFAILWSARDPGDESGGKIEKRERAKGDRPDTCLSIIHYNHLTSFSSYDDDGHDHIFFQIKNLCGAGSRMTLLVFRMRTVNEAGSQTEVSE